MIPPDSVPGRLGLLVTLFLCTVNTLNTVTTNHARPDDGSTALVRWILICLWAILLAMFEYGLILAMIMKQQKTQIAPTQQDQRRTAKVLVFILKEDLKTVLTIVSVVSIQIISNGFKNNLIQFNSL